MANDESKTPSEPESDQADNATPVTDMTQAADAQPPSENKKPPRYFSPLYRVAFNLARIPVSLVTKRTWEGAENLPKDTGFVAISNHASEFDSMTFMHFLLAHKIPVRVLAKAELFKVPGLGALMRATGQIPVVRKGKGADALIHAIEALKNGECVGIFPEGTLTRDPDYWPMKPKTGAARMALKARVPVVPIPQWGALDILDRYRRRPHLFPRARVTVKALPPVYLDDLYDRADDPEAWKEASERMMRPLVEELGRMRNATPPVRLWDKNVDGDMGKKGLAAMERRWAQEEPGVKPSQRRPRMQGR